MNESKNKLRMLCVLDILRKYSDEEHPLSSIKICEILEKEYNIKCERKATIYSDINTLKEFNDNYYNIGNISTPSKGFCIYEREFELPELYLLCDAVQSAHSVTKEKSKVLVSKLESFASVYQRKNIGSSVYIDNRHKSDNKSIYINIFYLQQAITDKKKVAIKYIRHNVDRNQERHYTISPYAMIWSNDRYYLICNNDTKQNLMHVRIDRIKNVEILEEESRSFELFTDYRGKFDAADYAEKMFNGFSGTIENIELICENSIYQDLLDRFGASSIKKYNSDYFSVRFTGAVSSGLVSWIMQYGDKIYIRSPQLLKSMFNNKINDVSVFQAKRDDFFKNE
ncbi:MAG: WYL domain-containing protein [Ruminococcaceae bacterium]|nr:WYL domain-containing protein [Oscillospiraceae bacterium]